MIEKKIRLYHNGMATVVVRNRVSGKLDRQLFRSMEEVEIYFQIRREILLQKGDSDSGESELVGKSGSLVGRSGQG